VRGWGGQVAGATDAPAVSVVGQVYTQTAQKVRAGGVGVRRCSEVREKSAGGAAKAVQQLKETQAGVWEGGGREACRASMEGAC